jgi:hypothetical protein
LRRQIICDLRLEPPASAPLPASDSESASASGMTGREAELRRVRGLLADAAEGRGFALLVQDMPGVARSALLRVAADDATVRGFFVLSTAGLRHGRRLRAARAATPVPCSASPATSSACPVPANGSRWPAPSSGRPAKRAACHARR